MVADQPPAAPATERLRDRIVDRLLTDIDTIARSVIALFAMLMLALVIGLSFSKTKTWQDTKELLNLILPVVSLVLGGAIGYFFRKDK